MVRHEGIRSRVRLQSWFGPVKQPAARNTPQNLIKTIDIQHLANPPTVEIGYVKRCRRLPRFSRPTIRNEAPWSEPCRRVVCRHRHLEIHPRRAEPCMRLGSYRQRRPVRRSGGSGRSGAGNRSQPRNGVPGSDGTRGNRRDTCSLHAITQPQPCWSDHLRELRAVSDVPCGNSLGSHRPCLLCGDGGGRSAGGLRRSLDCRTARRVAH